jgi:hypothetical protein
MLKLNSAGDTLWTRRDTTGRWFEIKRGWISREGIATFTGGSWHSDMNLQQFDSAGHSRWVHTFGGPFYDCAFQVIQTSDLGYVVPG